MLTIEDLSFDGKNVFLHVGMNADIKKSTGKLMRRISSPSIEVFSRFLSVCTSGIFKELESSKKLEYDISIDKMVIRKLLLRAVASFGTTKNISGQTLRS